MESYVELERLEKLISRLENLINLRYFELKELLMATQGDIDAMTQAISDLKAELANDVTNIQNEINTLESDGVNVTALQAAVSDLTSTVNTVNTIAPAPGGGSSSSSSASV